MVCENTRVSWVFITFTILLHYNVESQIILTKVDRTIDLSSQVAKISSQLTLENQGNAVINDFILAVEGEQYPHLSYLEVTVSRLMSLLLAT